MKRFYRAATVVPGTAGHEIRLDDRPVRTPAQVPLALPTAALAERIAAEWAAQGEKIAPGSMPLTQLANTAIDRLSAHREAVIDELVGYAGTDLVCYRAATPTTLSARQAEVWQPLLDWLERRHAARLAVVEGVLPAVQPEAAIEAVRAAVAAHDAFALAGLHLAAGAAGSVVIALALAEGAIDAGAAFAAALVDELWQAERWGEDAEAAARRARIRADLEAAADFIRLSRAG